MLDVTEFRPRVFTFKTLLLIALDEVLLSQPLSLDREELGPRDPQGTLHMYSVAGRGKVTPPGLQSAPGLDWN